MATTPGPRRSKPAACLVAFDYADVKVVNTQFKAMMRDLKYDFGELAINTYLQGYEYRKPYVLLPATTNGRHQHHTIFYNADRGPLTPRELSGKRVGVRAYTQTTGVWVRGFLAEDYAVDLKSITWLTFQDPHLAKYREPANVERAAAGKELKQMLLDGEIDGAILGDVAEQGPLRHLIRDHAGGRAALGPDARWRGDQPYGGDPPVDCRIPAGRGPRGVPHAQGEPRGSHVAGGPGRPAPLRRGRHRGSLEHMVAYAFQQGLIARRPTIDELFADAVRILGPEAD